jgi:predicted nucleic acid-binding protein
VIVLDASATVELLLQTATGIAVAARLQSPDETLHAPHLLDVEVSQVFRRFVLAGSLEEKRASAALLDLGELDVSRYPHDVLLPRVWQLYRNLSAYDAVYVALAEALGAVLLTADARLTKTPGHAVPIELVRVSSPRRRK